MSGLIRSHTTAAENTYEPGRCYFGRSNYVEYVAGDMPVVFSVPHGGELSPAEIPDRTPDARFPEFATISDANTEELALALHEAFRQYFGHSPHVIICRLNRNKVDCNRALEEAAGTNIFAQRAWCEFHDYINSAARAVATSAGRGLYIDLHGQSHPLKRVELGYLLSAQQLSNTDAVLSQPAYAARSSIRALAAEVRIPFAELLRGSNSLGGLLLAKGYPSLPDPAMPSPWAGGHAKAAADEAELYFGGGYNTRRHSAAGPGQPMDGVQLEANLEGVRDSAVNRTNFSLALAQALDRFFAIHYRINLKAGGSEPAATSKPVELRSAAKP